MDPLTDSPHDLDSKDMELESEIASLETRLAAARLRLPHSRSPPQSSKPIISTTTTATTTIPITYNPSTPTLHHLLLLSDSALPLGSFAFSSGLESFLHHTPPSRTPNPFSTFLPLSLSAHAGSTLPFVLAAHKNPLLLPDLDDAFDATIMCTVGRRASVAQGRALLGVWEKAFIYSVPPASPLIGSGEGDGVDEHGEALDVLRRYSLAVKRSSSSTASSTTTTSTPSSSIAAASAHLPPLFGTISRLLGLSAEQTAYIYLLGHVKALVSAAVRASVFGPYHAQKVLASAELVDMINAVVEREWSTSWEDAGQNVPMLDLWTGRHELLYSRIFNS